MNKLRSLPKLPGNIILCTADVVGLYPNIPHEEGLSALRKRLDNRMEKYISSDTLCDLAKVVLQKNFFKFGKNSKAKKRDCNQNKICTSLYSKAELEQVIVRKAEFKPYLWWGYTLGAWRRKTKVIYR